MTTQMLTYIVVGLTFALYIGIAVWSRAASTKDFYVAGAGVHPLTNGMATRGGLDERRFIHFHCRHDCLCRL